ncbi:MAG: hypothetical protein MR396_05315 [Phocaeicola sp.]|nr:hypothetical protein [Phocaeicola sp.]MDY3913997.1 hypothetical protein [Phocaeicola sp.]
MKQFLGVYELVARPFSFWKKVQGQSREEALMGHLYPWISIYALWAILYGLFLENFERSHLSAVLMKVFMVTISLFLSYFLMIWVLKKLLQIFLPAHTWKSEIEVFAAYMMTYAVVTEFCRTVIFLDKYSWVSLLLRAIFIAFMCTSVEKGMKLFFPLKTYIQKFLFATVCFIFVVILPMAIQGLFNYLSELMPK